MNELKNKKAIGFIIWAVGIVALAAYVPYGEYFHTPTGQMLVQDVTGYDWFFKQYRRKENGNYVLINYTLMWSKIGAWTAVYIGYLFIIKDGK